MLILSMLVGCLASCGEKDGEDSAVQDEEVQEETAEDTSVEEEDSGSDTAEQEQEDTSEE